MKNSKYYIIPVYEDSILVVINSWERFEYYLDELEAELSHRSENLTVYFDFLVKNGPRDRFFKTTISQGKLDLRSFKSIKVETKLEEISNQYFSKNIKVLDDSLLTKAQRFLYKRELELV